MESEFNLMQKGEQLKHDPISQQQEEPPSQLSSVPTQSELLASSRPQTVQELKCPETVIVPRPIVTRSEQAVQCQFRNHYKKSIHEYSKLKIPQLKLALPPHSPYNRYRLRILVLDGELEEKVEITPHGYILAKTSYNPFQVIFHGLSLSRRIAVAQILKHSLKQCTNERTKSRTLQLRLFKFPDVKLMDLIADALVIVLKLSTKYFSVTTLQFLSLKEGALLFKGNTNSLRNPSQILQINQVLQAKEELRLKFEGLLFCNQKGQDSNIEIIIDFTQVELVQDPFEKVKYNEQAIEFELMSLHSLSNYDQGGKERAKQIQQLKKRSSKWAYILS